MRENSRHLQATESWVSWCAQSPPSGSRLQFAKLLERIFKGIHTSFVRCPQEGTFQPLRRVERVSWPHWIWDMLGEGGPEEPFPLGPLPVSPPYAQGFWITGHTALRWKKRMGRWLLGGESRREVKTRTPHHARNLIFLQGLHTQKGNSPLTLQLGMFLITKTSPGPQETSAAR